MSSESPNVNVRKKNSVFQEKTNVNSNNQMTISISVIIYSIPVTMLLKKRNKFEMKLPYYIVSSF